jgi:Uma2 family endonuclease
MVTQTRITAQEFFELPESNTLIELLDGEVIVSPTPTPKHQDATGNIYFLLRQLVPAIGGKVFAAPLSVYLDEDNVPEPDVIWVAANSRCISTETRLEGPPDLLVEVLSPSTAHKDKIQKFKLYERHGVRGYWIVDTAHRLLEAWTLVEGRFVSLGIFGPDDTFQSLVLGQQTVPVSDIFGP